MSTVNLNLARKWRSRNFDQIIGQELTVRILKNSLFLNHLFPLYLLSGQHGCGKTTTARIFAAAVNCDQLDLFQKDPKSCSLPCLQCLSCKAMATGSHPDFIEIDGASHTGVDNVRHIIDVASFLPLMGRKKIYLIDEAHMLSKAAFNAFLKILEEPPASAFFMLATTELHKIIETVRSRSFQLFFKSVQIQTLEAHLTFICNHETIAYEKEGLTIVAQQSKGSVRDALNLLEQARFESDCVTKDSVIRMLGYVDETITITLFEHVVSDDIDALLHYITSLNTLSSIENIWKSLLDLINAIILIKHDIVPKNFTSYGELLKKIGSLKSVNYFSDCLALLFEYELSLIKTGFPQHLFEMVLLRMCKISDVVVEKKSYKTSSLPEASSTKNHTAQKPAVTHSLENKSLKTNTGNDFSVTWKNCIATIDNQDPLLGSIFKQATFDVYDDVAQCINITFGKEFTFFNDILEKGVHVWKPLLSLLFGENIKLQVTFKETQKNYNQKLADTTPATPIQVRVIEKNKVPAQDNRYQRSPAKKGETFKNVDTSDTVQWKKANLLKTVFNGTIQELPEGYDE